MVFTGSHDLHYYANPETANAPGFELKVAAKSEDFEFGDAVLPKWEMFIDSAGKQVEVYAGSLAEDVRIASTRLVRAANVLGLPALSMPCGYNREGLPLGLQLIGQPFREDLILRLGAALEDATSFHSKMPSAIQ